MEIRVVTWYRVLLLFASTHTTLQKRVVSTEADVPSCLFPAVDLFSVLSVTRRADNRFTAGAICGI